MTLAPPILSSGQDKINICESVAYIRNLSSLHVHLVVIFFLFLLASREFLSAIKYNKAHRPGPLKENLLKKVLPI